MATRPRFRTGVSTAGKLTPQQALIVKNDQVGNTHIKNMQGTTRTLYHFLPLDGRTTFNFFKELNKFAFPFTNIDQNKLNAGETMALQRAYFAYMSFDPATGRVVNMSPIEITAVYPSVAAGIWNFTQANQNITKDILVASFLSVFNKAARFQNQAIFRFDTLASLLENVEFYSTLNTSPYVAIANAHIGLVIEGVGSILNLKTNQ